MGNLRVGDSLHRTGDVEGRVLTQDEKIWTVVGAPAGVDWPSDALPGCGERSARGPEGGIAGGQSVWW